MTHHHAKRNHWVRRAVVAGALPVAIAAASTGTAHAQDTGSANLPALPEVPQVDLPPLWNPYDLSARPLNVFQPGYAPTPEQRIADYTDTGRFLGGNAGMFVGGMLIGVPAGLIGGAASVPVGGPLNVVAWVGNMAGAGAIGTIVGMVGGGSVGAELGAQAGVNLAHEHNATGSTNPLS